MTSPNHEGIDRRWRLVAPVLLAIAVAVALAPRAMADDDEPAPPADAATGETEEAPPSLDDLLGLEEDGEDEADDVSPQSIAEAEAEDELQRRLNEESLSNAFAVAIDKMKRCAVLLEDEFDTGLGTQRLQEEILAKLDQLIDQAKKQQCQGSSSSSSSSSSSKQQSQAQKKPGKQGERPTQAQKQPGTKEGASSDSGEGAMPPGREGELTQVFDEARIEWGTLPERARDMLLQGREEKFSSLYEQLTREYYRRLAEEGSS